MPLPPNTRLGHYEIRTQVGAGGMGEVYLAEDTRLDRQVAIKFLHEEFSHDADKLNRFIQEAKAASALNHPNILTVYEVGAADGKNYIAAEFIAGRTLREHLSPGESIPLNAILKIGVQVAEALSAAHHAGIIHRDIKPENIMLREDGYAKVLDFGLAKLTEERRSERVSLEGETKAFVQTNPGMVMGTVSYMSPEQARGLQTDARTDIWSLGVVLYEMLAGRAPFTGETVNHTIVSILEREPLLLENVPDELQRIVREALTKEKEMRYQTARDLLIDLKNLRRTLDIQGELERSVVPNRTNAAVAEGENATRAYAAARTKDAHSASSLEYAVTQARSHKLAAAIVGIVLLGAVSAVGYFGIFAGGGKKQIESIAVLPFVNESGNADFEYLSDGMTETLINSLSQLPNLSVKARSTMFHYKGKDATPQQVGSELSVQAVLNGRVTQHGDQLTLSLELVDARTGDQIWGEHYDRKAEELVALQSQIARDVLGRLRNRLSAANEQRLAKNYTEDAEAYKLYLQGVFYWNRLNSAKAVECFRQAVALDPNYALAYSGLGDAHLLRLVTGGGLPAADADEALSKAREYAGKALELDKELPDAHALMGLLLLVQDRDFAGFEREMNRAIELNPNFAEGHRRNGIRLLYLGQFEAARTEFRKALDLDPLSNLSNHAYVQTLVYEERYDEAEARIRKNLELDPGWPLFHLQLSTLYRLKGNYASAVEESAKASELQNHPEAARLKRDSFAKGGWQGYLRAQVAEAEQNRSNLYSSALAYVELGEKDKALAALEEAYNARSNLIYYIKIDPQLNPLRDDPRFTALLKKSGFPQ
jgi:eukaryotic-like serine/threonine-protein kinase